MNIEPFLIIFDHDGTLMHTETRQFTLFPKMKELILDLKDQGFHLMYQTYLSLTYLKKSQIFFQ